MKIEKTEICITCDKPLEGDGRKIRGFFVLDLLPTKVHKSLCATVKVIDWR